MQWLRFDAVRTAEIQQTATVTRHPVQKGADIADHVRVDLPSVSITGYISIAPLTVDAMVVRPKDIPIASGFYQPVPLPPGPAGIRASAIQGGLIQAAVNALSSVTDPKSVESLITQNPGDRAATAATTLLRLQSERTLIRFVDELNTYEDMVLTSVVGTRTQQVYGAAFQLQLEQLRIVSSMLVDLPVPAEPRGQLPKKTASTPKDSGKGPVDDAKKSAALRFAQGLFSGF
ncbi:MAG TPA: hypothetical protein VM493_07785 [Vicinamibacterales bacterium]|nr:hypothetical protein [Vicinamibacterales bacterium]